MLKQEVALEQKKNLHRIIMIIVMGFVSVIAGALFAVLKFAVKFF
jgi:hypothetical protein